MMRQSPAARTRTATDPGFLRLAGFTLAYVLCALLARQFVLPDGVPVFWPATGVLVAALLLRPTAEHPVLVALAVLAQVGIGIATGAGAAVSLAVATSGALTAILAHFFLRRASGGLTDAETVPHLLATVGLVFIAAALPSLPNAALVRVSLDQPPWVNWIVWWLAQSAGVLLVTPVIVSLSQLPVRAPIRDPRLVAEAALLGTALLVTSHIAFSTGIATSGLLALRTYIVFPFFIWAVVRFGLPGGTVAVLLASILAVWHTSHGRGPFMLLEPSLVHGIIGAQVFCAVSTTSVLALGTILNQRRRAETALRRSQEGLSLALEAGGMGTWNWNLRTGVIVWSEQHATLLGMRPDEFDGRYETFARRIHPDDLGPLEEAVRRAIERHTHYQHEYRVVWPDGSVRWVSGRGRTFQNAQGQTVRMAGTVMDVSARRDAEERERALADERARLLARLQLVLDRMPIGCIVNDEAFNISFWNPAAERIFGFRADEVVGRSPASFLIPATRREPVEALQQRVRAGEQISGTALTLTRSGRAIICEWQHTPLLDADGAFIGSLSMVQDVTERKAAEQEIRRLNADLEHRVAQRTRALEAANRDLESFSYSVSHDLRAPLRHIDGFVKLLTKREAERLDPTSRRYLEVIAEASRRMGQLIDDLLNLSRVGRLELQPQPVALGELVRSVIEEIDAAADGRTIAWEVGPLPAVLADPRLLRVVLVNLLSNAAKYTGTRLEPRVCIGESERTPDEATFFVRDNGVGFDMRYAHKLFGVFQRLHRDDEFEGTGVGLATVFRIVDRHGGRVRAEGEVERGATFYVTLPRA